tara:strand:- start:221 stop:373 length:153 start_codon:yes stop_codon:yes gene_type:complete
VVLEKNKKLDFSMTSKKYGKPFEDDYSYDATKKISKNLPKRYPNQFFTMK